MRLKSLVVFTVALCFYLGSASLAATNKNLCDVPKTHWARDAVKTVVDDYQFMQGDPNGNFGGSRALSRYEFAKTISKVVEYYNTALETNKQDNENLLSVMELFQNEMKSVDDRMTQLNNHIDSQNATVAELNELVLGLAEEINSIDPDSGKTKIAEMEERIALAEEKIASLKNRGLIVGTLIKGTANDIRKLGKATAHASQSIGRRLNRPGQQIETSTLENESVEPLPPSPATEDSKDENLTEGTIYQSIDNIIKSEVYGPDKSIALGEV
jgi:hypothetical protein